MLSLFICCSLSSFSQGIGQSIIASAGDISKGGNIILEWTVGEPVVETVSNSVSLYTQGFHQPLLQIQKWRNNTEMASATNSIMVYPNPTVAVINIQLNTISETPLKVSIIDVNGKLLLNNTFPSRTRSQRINVSRYPQGTYLLRIVNVNGVVYGEYKIIKAQ